MGARTRSMYLNNLVGELRVETMGQPVLSGL